MNILITGHEGFIANSIVGKLKKPGNLVVGIDREKNFKKKLAHKPDVEILGDVRNYDLLRRVITDYEIEEVYHLASHAIVKTCSNDPYSTFDTNVMGVVALLEACKNSGQEVKSITISTSDKAFGDAEAPYKETSPLKPLYAYDSSKACQQLITLSYYNNFKLPVKVVACGNVYGPGDFNMTRVIPKTMIKLMNNEPAILYEGSENHIREFVYIDDVAEAFITVSEKGKNGEVYCCGSKEYLKVKDLMERICTIMEKDPLKNIEVIKKPIQFREIEVQYLDNEKIKTLGWEPKTSLNEGLKKTKEFYLNLEGFSNKGKREEKIIKGADNFEDERGKIGNYYLKDPINWVGLINTIVKGNKNAIRANHYHPEQEQKVLVISGSYVSVYKDLLEKDGKVKCHLVKPGDLVVTPPNMAHAQIFLEDCVLLNLVKGERKHENYGKHTIPYELVKQGEAKFYIEKCEKEQFESLDKESDLKKKCKICGNQKLKQIISLGKTPLANSLLKEHELNKKEELFPLELDYCNNCHLCQLSHVVPPEKMFQEYLFVSSTTKTTKNHFQRLAKEIVQDFNLGKDSLIIDVGSNDGLFLKYAREEGAQILGIEPAANICEIAEKQGVKTICGFLNEDVVNEVLTNYKKAEVVTANNVFAHTGDIKYFTDKVKKIMKDDGIFIIEAQYVLDTIKKVTFDNIYHEHVSYFSVTALNEFFKRQNMDLFKVEHLDVHGGSIRIFVQNIGGKHSKDSSVDYFLEEEKRYGLTEFSTYENFARKVLEKKQKTKELLLKLKSEGKKIIGYGSPAKATTLLNFYGINSEHLDYIIEDNPLKQNRVVPGVRIPIKGHEFDNSPPDYIYILAWNFAEEIIKNNQRYLEKGSKFIISYPELKIV